VKRDWLVTSWQDLTESVRPATDSSNGAFWLPVLIMAGLLFLVGCLFYKQMMRSWRNFRRVRQLTGRLVDFSPLQIQRRVRHYIWPEGQDVDPGQSEDLRHTITVSHDLAAVMDRLLVEDTPRKHFLLLADQGMGKTSFLLNYYARHLNRWPRRFQLVLLSLTAPQWEERIKRFQNPAKTVLFLDGLDEAAEPAKDLSLRLSAIMAATRHLAKVVITCSTPFSPHDHKSTKQTGLFQDRLNPSHPLGSFYALYLSPFSADQVRAFLTRSLGLWQKHKHNELNRVIQKITDFPVHPIFLSYVEEVLHTQALPTHAFSLYSRVVDNWLAYDDSLGNDSQKLRLFAEKLALAIYGQSDRVRGESIARDQMVSLGRPLGIDTATWQPSDRSLLHRDGRGDAKFIHRSIAHLLMVRRLMAGDPAFLQIPYALLVEMRRSFLWDAIERQPAKLPVGVRYSILSVPFSGGEYVVQEIGHKVTLSPFTMSMFPITNLEYEEFDPSHKAKRDKCSDQDNQPVVNVSWQDAIDFCTWLSEKAGVPYRMPTEAEWEYAASGSGARRFPWGDEPVTGRQANFDGSKINKTTAVDAYPLGRTPEGVYDLAGNVWEWCADWYDKEKKGRVIRGGSYVNDASKMRCSDRYFGLPNARVDNLGFRVVQAKAMTHS